MSVYYDLFEFAGAPRTGTTWFLKAMSAAGLGDGAKTHVHTRYVGRTDTLRVTQVRNPADWLRSYYTSIHPGSSGVLELDVLQQLDHLDFDTFVRSYLHFCPGQLTNVFHSYPANVVHRIEDQPWALIELIETYRPLTKQQLKAIKSITPQNCSKHLPPWDEGLRYQVLWQSDKELTERYEYY